MELKYEWYFAIASMMNKVSITNRGVIPLESVPAELLDYELIFFGGMGMACAQPCEGKSFHGVLHKCKEEHMLKLDKIESVYERIPSKAKLYDGTIIDCTVYGDPSGNIIHSDDKPPTERYIDIIIEGAT